MRFKDGNRWRTTPMNHEELAKYIADRIRVVNGHEIWQLSLDTNGFPRGKNAGKRIQAHRMVWTHRTGEELTRDMLILNRCGVVGCVSPEHHVKVHGHPLGLRQVPVADRVPRPRAKGK